MNTATVVTDPERQFLGCVLWMPHTTARAVLSGMRATDMADPMCSHVLQLVIEVVAAGHAPEPVTIYARATTTGHAPGEEGRHRLSRWLADTYGHTVQLPDTAWHLKTVVLEAAWRRALAEHAQRLLHAIDHSPTDILATLADTTSPADDLWARYRAALAHTTPKEVAA